MSTEMSLWDCVVVGSGPSGTAASKALLDAGAKVLMLDVGHRLELERQRIVDQLAASEPIGWDQALVESLRGCMDVGVSGLPQKLVYGSEYAYADPFGAVRLVQHGTELFTSQALGGLSNVWGSNLLPFLGGDMEGWPVGPGDLAPFYERALELMPYAARQDSLSEIMPLHAEHHRPLEMGSQAREILADLEKHRDRLGREGVSFGQSRLAIDAKNCRYCGMCLYGCPYQLIYSSAQTLEQLKARPGFHYTGSVSVEALAEREGAAVVSARVYPSGETAAYRAGRVFLAAGAVGSAKILLRSLGAYGQPIEFKDSQYFLAPMLRFRATEGVEAEKLHTLSQIAIVIRDPRVASKSVEMLIYTYNDMFDRALAKLLPHPALRKPFLSRLFVVQGYLHSDDSHPIRMSLSEDGRLNMAPAVNPRARAAMRQVKAKLRAIQASMGAFAIPGFTKIGAPGKSYHIGASFPMQGIPQGFASDTLGRPTGFDRVHLVDASCLPSIPSTNITLTVMANAMRIATHSTRE